MRKLTLLFLVFSFGIIAQKKGIVKGRITNKFDYPISGVAISYLKEGTTTDENGNYELTIPINKTIGVLFSHISYKNLEKKFTAYSSQVFNFSPKMEIKSQELEEVIIKNYKKQVQGITTIKTKKIKKAVGPNGGVESVLMTLPGVSNNNELSTQYNVRGGNFDENLVYVNGIEIYRSFLIRSGQQEGLSFINSQMIQNIDFSAGGFQAKYGDKLSSVLDITYRKPKSFQAQIDLSFLGGSATIEDVFLDEKLSAILGVRYRNNSLLVKSKDTEVNFRPKFTDIQSFISYKVSKNLTFNFLGNFSLNDYQYKPLTRRTRFGSLDNPKELIVFYDGQEKDKFQTFFGAFSSKYKVNKDLKITTIISSFNTQEEEYFDILAQYNLGEINTNSGSENFGETESLKGIGAQLNHSRNDLDALITSAQIKAKLKDGKNEWRCGLKFQTENVKDRIREWEVIDSVGFLVRPPTHKIPRNQPYSVYEGNLHPFQNIRLQKETTINRSSGFMQFSRKTFLKEHQIWMNIGVRVHSWMLKSNQIKNHFVFSPRMQFAIKPDWEKDMLFRISGGLYTQPPLYKEFRKYDGALNFEVKAQKSIHVVLGNEYSFLLWDRPFKFISESYYKNMSDVNAYSVDNVRLRYRADNLTDAYAYGFDFRLNGEFVPGNDSWISLGFLKTEENIDDKGYIARPTDQRFKFGMLFQDYVPSLPDMKAYINLVYNTGLPGGSPAYSDVYQFQNRLDSYKRADIGISYIFIDANKQKQNRVLSYFKELTVGMELFNVFGINNSITNTWVRDVYSKQQYAIPNYMTGRVLNLKLDIKF